MPELTWPSVLGALLHGRHLSPDEAAWAMDEVMSGEATPVQIAGLMVALRAKGETPEEMEGLARAMLGRARRIEVAGPAVDIVGTGGDLAHTVNISTMAALVVAGTGAKVVKHGNRAASSACGTADVLEALGVDLTLEPDQVAEVAEEVGITFCFAQVHHPSFRFAAAPRRELGVATSFNFLGPLTNPAQPAAQAIGCADSRMAGVMAEVFARRGASAVVFRGDDGLDELTTTTTSAVWVVREGSVEQAVLDPVDLGLPRAEPAQLKGADPAYNAGVVRDLLAGTPGPVRDAVLLNAAAALVALDHVGDAGPQSGTRPAAGLLESMAGTLQRAARSVDEGAAAAVLDRWVAATRRRSAG